MAGLWQSYSMAGLCQGYGRAMAEQSKALQRFRFFFFFFVDASSRMRASRVRRVPLHFPSSLTHRGQTSGRSGALCSSRS